MVVDQNQIKNRLEIKYMLYVSTRDKNKIVNSTSAILKGLASDGGLFVVQNLSDFKLNLEDLGKLSTKEIFKEVLGFLIDDIESHKLDEIINRAYDNKFESEDMIPLVKVDQVHIVELFHGPTAAFKDMALSLLPHLLLAAKEVENDPTTSLILTATSGDTGKAALEGFAHVDKAQIIVFYPSEGVSSLQKLQMVSQEGDNVLVCAIDGNFDHAQTAIKEVFKSFSQGDLELDGQILSSANSINIGRLAPQVAYYFKSYGDLVKKNEIVVGEEVDFLVPTGNFGNILAAYMAKEMGLPIGKLVCASNENKVLDDFIRSGVYNKKRDFHPTNSPSMDIIISSNLERLLWYLSNKDHDLVKSLMEDLNEKGEYAIGKDMLNKLKENFYSSYATEEETLATIKKVWTEQGYLLDPHTAVAWKAYEDYKKTNPKNKLLIMATASPYKFPNTILKALDIDEEEDSFKAMEVLSSYSKTPIPKSLMKLRYAKILHKDLIEKDEILEYVKKKAGDLNEKNSRN